MVNAIHENWQNSAIGGSMQLKRKSRRAYMAIGVPNYCSSCDNSSKCMRLISDGSPNVMNNYGNIWQSSQVPHQHPSILTIPLRVRSRRGTDTCLSFRSVMS